MRFEEMILGKKPDRVPVVAKIWLDWAASHGYIGAKEALSDPALAMYSVIRACVDTRMDAARLFLMPKRETLECNGELWQVNALGKRLGRVDLSGGWATRLLDPADFRLDDPEITMNIQSYTANVPPVNSVADARRIAVPDVDWYEERGYGDMVEGSKRLADGKLSLIGDCNCGTLSFVSPLRGMHAALIDLIDDPELIHACMEKGVRICLERARFFVRHGITVLRYNDSSANMMLISPKQWREFVYPHLRDFCAEAHALDTSVCVYCHMCGNILPVIEDIRRAGIDMIAPLDPLSGHSVSDHRRAVGPDALLMGGVNTLTLLRKDAREVAREARSCIREGGDRFALGSGCAVARDTPPENLLALALASEQEANCG